jgi:hypothetical protein
MKLLTALACITGLAASAAGQAPTGLVVLNPTASSALRMVGDSVIKVPARTVYVNSNSNQAITTHGTVTLDAGELWVVGNYNFTGQSYCTCTPQRTNLPWEDTFNLATPSLQGQPQYTEGSYQSAVNLSPGYYPNGIKITGNAQVHLEPGTYSIGGPGFDLTSGELHGDGVTLVIHSGALNISGASSIYLTPQYSGPLAGAVIFQPAANTTAMKLSGSSETVIIGMLYAPSAPLTLVGTGQINTDEGPQMADMVIANRVELSGRGAIKIGREGMRALNLMHPPLYD